MSDSKAARRKKSLIRARKPDAGETEAAEQDPSAADSDWGFSEGSAKLSAQTIMFLAATLFLVGAAGYYAWQKFLAPPAAASSAENNEPGGEGLPVAKINGGKPEQIADENSGENYGGSFGNPENAETQSPTGETDNESGFVQGEPVNDEHFPENNGSDPTGGYPFEQHQPSGQTADQTAGAPENPFGESPDFDRDRSGRVDPTYGIPSEHDFNPNGYQDQFDQPAGSAAGHSAVTQTAEDRFFPGDQGDETPADPFNQMNEAAPQEMVQSEPLPAQQDDSTTLSEEETFPGDTYQSDYGDGTAGDYRQNAPGSATEPRQLAADEAGGAAEPVQGLFGGPVDETQYSQSPSSQDNGSAEFTNNDSPQYSSGVTAGSGFTDTSGDRFGGKTAGTVRHVDPSGESPGSTSSPFGMSTRRQAEYEIQPEDSYWKISMKVYGTARYFLALSRYNEDRIPDTKRMRPGIKILTPSIEELEAKYPDLFPKRSVRKAPAGESAEHSSGVQTAAAQESGFFRNREGRPNYRVGENDTLSGIARDHLGRASRWVQVYEMNRDRIPDPDSLKIGTVLRLPADASNVQLVRMPPDDR